jgi:predicted Zn-dependent protease
MGRKFDDRTDSEAPKPALPGLGGGAVTGKLPGSDLFNGLPFAPSSRSSEAKRLAKDGKRLIDAGRAAKAVEVLRRAVDLKPDDAATQPDLGSALMATGRLQEAAETFALAIRLDGRIPAAHYYLAQIFDGFGQEAMWITRRSSTPHRNARRITTASVWQARQPIYRTSVERWRRYEPWLGELRELAPETNGERQP